MDQLRVELIGSKSWANVPIRAFISSPKNLKIHFASILFKPGLTPRKPKRKTESAIVSFHIYPVSIQKFGNFSAVLTFHVTSRTLTANLFVDEHSYYRLKNQEYVKVPAFKKKERFHKGHLPKIKFKSSHFFSSLLKHSVKPLNESTTKTLLSS
jgi:hypothetical protein